MRTPDPPFVHASAIIDEPTEIGQGTKVWHFCHVMSGARIGADCILGQNVFVATGAQIGDGVRIQNNVSIYDGCIIEDDVFLGPSCVLTNVVNPRSAVARKHEFKRTLIRRGATVGANATIVCGSTIGEYAFIGAGAVVTGNVAPHTLVHGVPARPQGFVCRCGVKLSKALSCPACGEKYSREGDGLSPK